MLLCCFGICIRCEYLGVGLRVGLFKLYGVSYLILGLLLILHWRYVPNLGMWLTVLAIIIICSDPYCIWSDVIRYNGLPSSAS